MAFPSSPVDGQQAVVNNIVYNYNSTKGAWIRLYNQTTTLTADKIILTNINNDSITLSGGLTAAGNIIVTGNILSSGTSVFGSGTTSNIVVAATTTSSSTTTGALVVRGGVGIVGNVVVGDSIISAVNSGFGSVSSRFTANMGSKADFHITTNTNGISATATQQYGMTFAVPGGNTQAAILISENGSDGTAVGFYTTNSYAAGPQFRMQIDPSGHILPGANVTYDLGSTGLRWRNIYTGDLNLSNGRGDYTIVEGEEDLFLYNNRTGKTYKFVIQEVDPSIVPNKLR